MPSARSSKDTEPASPPVDTSTKTAPAEPTVDAAEPTPEPAEPTGPQPGVYEYTYFADCVYPHVPLSARAATPDTPATVFDWPFGPPQDGRWAPTSKKPNQAADNAGPLTSEE